VLFGGSVDKSKHLNDLFEFSFETNRWTQRNSTGTPSPRAGHLAFYYKENFYLFGGYTGDGGFERLADSYCLRAGSIVWEEAEVRGSLPMTGRPVSFALDEKRGFLYMYGGYDGSKPLGSLLEFHLDVMGGVATKLWMEMDETNIASSAVGSKGMTPLPRYGNVIVVENGVITVCLGSGSTYLDDIFEIDTNPDEE